MAGKGFSDADDQAPLYLRTTEEMLEEFEYLGSEKAERGCHHKPDEDRRYGVRRSARCGRINVRRSLQIRTRCCVISVITRRMRCTARILPEIVIGASGERVEFHHIQRFAVMYIIAQKLVWKSNEDGYLVGSRGSVGSSFVATMAGITEVNPLSPHYYCAAMSLLWILIQKK